MAVALTPGSDDAATTTATPATTVTPATAGGNRIAFTSDRSGDEEVWVMNADGTNPTNLTNNPDDDVEPAWSP